jgi:hypothetical protein
MSVRGETPSGELGGSAWSAGSGKAKTWQHDGCFFDAETQYCGIFTADTDGRLVQALSSPSWGSCQLDFLVDLDGDGLDEVGWSTFGTEDEMRMFSRLLATSIETTTLFESGL